MALLSAVPVGVARQRFTSPSTHFTGPRCARCAFALRRRLKLAMTDNSAGLALLLLANVPPESGHVTALHADGVFVVAGLSSFLRTTSRSQVTPAQSVFLRKPVQLAKLSYASATLTGVPVASVALLAPKEKRQARRYSSPCSRRCASSSLRPRDRALARHSGAAVRPEQRRDEGGGALLQLRRAAAARRASRRRAVVAPLLPPRQPGRPLPRAAGAHAAVDDDVAGRRSQPRASHGRHGDRRQRRPHAREGFAQESRLCAAYENQRWVLKGWGRRCCRATCAASGATPHSRSSRSTPSRCRRRRAGLEPRPRRRARSGGLAYARDFNFSEWRQENLRSCGSPSQVGRLCRTRRRRRQRRRRRRGHHRAAAAGGRVAASSSAATAAAAAADGAPPPPPPPPPRRRRRGGGGGGDGVAAGRARPRADSFVKGPAAAAGGAPTRRVAARLRRRRCRRNRGEPSRRRAAAAAGAARGDGAVADRSRADGRRLQLIALPSGELLHSTALPARQPRRRSATTRAASPPATSRRAPPPLVVTTSACGSNALLAVGESVPRAADAGGVAARARRRAARALARSVAVGGEAEAARRGRPRVCAIAARAGGGQPVAALLHHLLPRAQAEVDAAAASAFEWARVGERLSADGGDGSEAVARTRQAVAAATAAARAGADGGALAQPPARAGAAAGGGGG